MRTDIKDKARHVMEYLVAGRFAELEALTGGVRLSARDMAIALKDCQGTLVMPPSSEFDRLNIIELRDSNPMRWSVIMPIWTKENGRSDVSVELTIVHGEKCLTFELDDIHVL